MSPEVAENLRQHPCVCGALPGERCIAQPSGKRTDHVHQNRAYADLFRKTTRTQRSNP